MSSLLSSWILFLGIGKILIYLFDNFPFPDVLEQHQTIHKLHHCHLCAGTWIYGLLSFGMGLSLLEALGFTYFPIVSEIVTGGVISFVVFIFSEGWREVFRDILVI